MGSVEAIDPDRKLLSIRIGLTIFYQFVEWVILIDGYPIDPDRSNIDKISVKIGPFLTSPI
jgi:hypothetical protein